MFGFKWRMVRCMVVILWLAEHFSFGNVFLWYFFIASAAISLIFALLTYDYDYWEMQGIVSPPAVPFVGHVGTVATFREQGGMCFKRIYEAYPKERFLGTHQFFQRTFVVRDPSLIKSICVNDFAYFVDRGFFFNKDVDPLAGSVLFLRGNEWRKLRAKITPIFSPSKLRGMLPLIESTADDFVLRVKYLLNKGTRNISDAQLHNGNITRKSIDNFKMPIEEKKDYTENMRDNHIWQKGKECFFENKELKATLDSEKLIGGYTADAIVPCAFGLKSNVMENPNDPFAVALHAFYEMSFYNIFEKTMRQFWPAFALFFRMRIIPRKTHDFFVNIVTGVLRAREQGLQEKRGDFIDMMMLLRSDDENNNRGTKKDDDYVEISDIVISANAFIIFLGGYETTSSTLAFLMLELAAHPEVQMNLRKELTEVLNKYNGQITYEMLQDLIYMEMVIQETLRLYPPFPNIQRLCTKDYKIPNSDKMIEKGTVVLFPTLGIQRDSQYFADADSFIPERFAEGAPVAPPGVYMPFGDGPRYCIGKRFAWIQMKTCLLKFLPVVWVSPAPGAPPRTAPFTAEPRSPLTLHPQDSTVTLHYRPSCIT